MRKLYGIAPVGVLVFAAAVSSSDVSILWATARVAAAPRPGSGPITFNNQVVRILQARCQSCHREGGIAPFALTTYKDAFSHRKKIRREVLQREMPPWKAAPGCADFLDDPSLSKEEIQTIARWVNSGAPEGDSRDLPPRREFSGQWLLGEPDLKLTMAADFTPDFSNGDVYRCFVFPTHSSQDHFVNGVEVVPGNRTIVHHALVWVEEGASSEQLIRGDRARSYPCFGSAIVPIRESLGEWGPGNLPHIFPEGVGRPFPKDSRVIMQVHYSARFGSVRPDRTTIGIHFAKSPVRKRFLGNWVYGPDNFVIPAGRSRHTLKGAIPSLPSNIHVYAMWPHMHLLGKTMAVTATLPDGTKRCLADVRNWEFHWQRTYWFRSPIALPAGTRLDLVATYDNSSANPSNPIHPPREVRLGQGTTDEMCQAAYYYTLDDEDLGAPAPKVGRRGSLSR